MKETGDRFGHRILASAESDFGYAGQVNTKNAAHSADINRWGLFFPSRYNGRVFAENFLGMQQNITGITTGTFKGIPLVAIGDRVYKGNEVYSVLSKSEALDLDSEDINIPHIIGTDYAVYGNYLYWTGSSLSDTKLYRVDLTKYRAPAVRSHILPQFISEGESLPLKYLVEGAEHILFESGFEIPSYLSIDSNLNLVVANNILLKDTTLLVKLRAFSLRAETPLQFYLVIRKKVAPVWSAIEVLPIDLGETVNLFAYCEGAASIAWKSGVTPPTGYVLSSGKLTVTGTTSEIQVTATNANGSTDKTLKVQVDVSAALVSSHQFGYRLEIEGIDVTEDMIKFSSIHASLGCAAPE